MRFLIILSAILWSGTQLTQAATLCLTGNPDLSEYPDLPPGGPIVSPQQEPQHKMGRVNSIQLPPPYMLDNQGNTFRQALNKG
jgi:hypothetical protein